MVIRLYIDYISQPARTVLAFCKISKIPVQILEVRIAKLQHLSEQYQQINPMKKVPAIVDNQNQLALGQSHAITNYLIRKFKLEEKWGLVNEISRAKIDEYLHYHHQNTRKCAFILFTQVFARLYPIDQQSIPKGGLLREQVKRVLDFIESNYFKDSKYMIGKGMTVADISAYYEIKSLIVVDFDFSPWKNIVRWMHELETIPEVNEANHNFMRLLPKIKPKPSL